MALAPRLWLCTAFLLLWAACSPEPTESAGARSQRKPANAASVCKALTGIRGMADYDPAHSPRQLAERSELVIEGTMEEVVQGRVFWPDDPVPGRSVVMVVEVERVHKGELPPASRRRIYIESQPHGNLPASHFDRLLPREAGALFFLVRYPLPGTEDSPGSPEIGDELGGRPWGQPLWQLTTPQGFLVEFDAEGVVGVPECRRYPDADLADFYPDREAFPTPIQPG